jgi:BASS family bile acid:Na+ symporter
VIPSNDVPILTDFAVPVLTFVILAAVGSDLTPADFARVRRQPLVVAVGLLVPLILLPPIALALVTLLEPAPHIEAGLLLVAACPIGGISNTYSYLARASPALSVTLTGLSSLLAVVTIPAIDRLFQTALQRQFGFVAPAELLVTQLLLMLALPIGFGMWIRHRWPRVAEAHRQFLQRVGFGAVGLLLAFVIVIEARRFLSSLTETVPLAALFVGTSLIAGWVVAGALKVSDRDRFTLAAEFATRNVAVATAIAITLLGRVEFAIFATAYILTELPLMLGAVAVFRRVSVSKPGSRS